VPALKGGMRGWISSPAGRARQAAAEALISLDNTTNLCAVGCYNPGESVSTKGVGLKELAFAAGPDVGVSDDLGIGINTGGAIVGGTCKFIPVIGPWVGAGWNTSDNAPYLTGGIGFGGEAGCEGGGSTSTLVLPFH
jgi:hypothetical protein